ncbi:hypothetical protein FXV83_16225 [Bradyrhizobium hipponense]|uniref:Uncharacterized protein n=1 Tax=Bradyrhizobium hipponense TaxID=2605638 RepID=A0A5S4YM39_9BRAD|nr:hypothetical protein [Bradyrhizobium hipponense]TYO65481.1 hypothetical protein FXV83_16225 [Bradyrhizobium hipponense]
MTRLVPRPQPTLTVVTKDGSVAQVCMRSLRIAREAAHVLNDGGNYRAVFARLQPPAPRVPRGWAFVEA